MRGLQKVSARCGLLPKSYWIPHTSLAVPDGAFSAAGRVSSTRQRSIDGHLVAVKTIDPECIDNFSAFKHVRLPFPSSSSLLMSPYVGALSETVHQCGHLEAATTSECGEFPWVRLQLSPLLPRIPLDSQREPFRLLERSSRCQ